MPGSPDDTPGAISLVADGAVPHLRFTGRIDRDAVREFRLRVRPAAWPARVDLSHVASIDPGGLELLHHLARKQKRTGGELQLVEPPAALRHVLEQSGLDRVSHWVAADGPATPV